MLNTSRKDAKKFASRTGKKWVDSKLIDYCAECDKKFTIVNRKHHCRQVSEERSTRGVLNVVMSRIRWLYQLRFGNPVNCFSVCIVSFLAAISLFF